MKPPDGKGPAASARPTTGRLIQGELAAYATRKQAQAGVLSPKSRGEIAAPATDTEDYYHLNRRADLGGIVDDAPGSRQWWTKFASRDRIFVRCVLTDAWGFVSDPTPAEMEDVVEAQFSTGSFRLWADNQRVRLLGGTQ